MKKIAIIFLIFVTQIIFPQEEKISVSIYSPIENSSIFIDDNFAGNDSAIVFLKKGSHDLLIKENNRNWNAVRFRDSIYLRRDSLSVVIDYGAIVPAELASNAEFMILTNAGSEKQESVSSLWNFGDFSATYDYSKPVKLNFETSKEKRFIESTAFKLLIGSAIALGATAAYFKIKADDNFDKYQSSLNKSFLDETDKYDLYSGIAFGALQVNFGTLLYQFLKEH